MHLLHTFLGTAIWLHRLTSPGKGFDASVALSRQSPLSGQKTMTPGVEVGSTVTEVPAREQRPEVRGHVGGASCCPQPRRHLKANFSTDNNFALDFESELSPVRRLAYFSTSYPMERKCVCVCVTHLPDELASKWTTDTTQLNASLLQLKANESMIRKMVCLHVCLQNSCFFIRRFYPQWDPLTPQKARRSEELTGDESASYTPISLHPREGDNYSLRPG